MYVSGPASSPPKTIGKHYKTYNGTGQTNEKAIKNIKTLT